MANQQLISEDGTHTISSEKYGVTYHSIYGALNESITVFLSAGLQYQVLKGKKDISIFEMGLGTGLNALLTMIEAEKYRLNIKYHAIELHPITVSEAASLNFLEQLDAVHLESSFDLLHACPPDHEMEINPYFRLFKNHGDLLTTHINGKYDVVYYDAFAPTAQEELWTPEVMKKMYDILNEGGVLVSYCAKGSFKRALKSAGFKVEALPGPPGKREMTRAIK